MPPKEDYCYETMTIEKKKEFEEWYATNYQTEFYLPEQLEIYCKSDVTILAHATQAFYKLFTDTTQIDPFISCTISEACMRAYCTNFLPEKSMVICPEYFLTY